MSVTFQGPVGPDPWRGLPAEIAVELAKFNEQKALADFVAPRSRISGVKSCLAAALDDSEVAFGGVGRDASEGAAKALWLGSLGYLVTVEMVGKYLGRGRGSLPELGRNHERFNAAVSDFGRPSDSTTSDALWDLRCSLAHQFTTPDDVGPQTQGKARHRYRLSEVGDLHVPAAKAADSVPTTNVWELQDYVLRLIVNLREFSAQGDVALRVSWEQLVFQGMFYEKVAPPPKSVGSR